MNVTEPASFLEHLRTPPDAKTYLVGKVTYHPSPQVNRGADTFSPLFQRLS